MFEGFEEFEMFEEFEEFRNPKLFKPNTLLTRNSSNPKPFNRAKRAQRS
jgi:hypothetical protein